MLSTALLFLSFVPYLGFAADCSDIVRHRKPWSMLDAGEKSVFVKGIQAIRKNGKLDTITESHAHTAVDTYVHMTAIYTMWHSYLVWEVETAIRELGGEFSCFAMPFWDWTLDAGKEDDPMILHSGIGGDGVEDNDYCITNNEEYPDFNWQTCQSKEEEADSLCYYSPMSDYCADDETMPYCCLKRSLSSTTTIATAQEIGEQIYQNDDIYDFQSTLSDWHNLCHTLIAGVESSQFVDGKATEDPLFFLLHTMGAYILSMWQTCHNYDNIPQTELQDHASAYHTYCMHDISDCSDYLQDLDDPFELWELAEVDWSLAKTETITSRKGYYLQNWGVKYEVGPFWENSGVSTFCDGDLNDNWFEMSMDYSENEDNEVNAYAKELRADMMEKGYDTEEILTALASKACKFVRKNSGNSCYEEEMEDIEIESCEDLSDEEVELMTLDDLLSRGGVSDSDCLQEIRTKYWKVMSVQSGWSNFKKRDLCDGSYDYKCPEWTDSMASKKSLLKSHQSKNADTILPGYAFLFLALFMIAIGGAAYYYYKSRTSDKVLYQKLSTETTDYGSLET